MHLLTIIISTLNTGILHSINAVSLLHPEICYLVIHQNNQNIAIPKFLDREDIRIISSKTKGLSRSRNLGLVNCKTEFALIADDDVSYIEDGIKEVLRIIKEDAPDFASFKIKTPENEPEFRDYQFEKHNFNETSIPTASIEILLNVEKIKKLNIAFDLRFGLGSKLRQGEEEIFINDLIKNNLIGTYYPIFIVNHPYDSTANTKRKELFYYFLKGAYNQRINSKISLPIHENRFRNMKMKFFYFLGKNYIYFTKKNHLV